MLEVRNLAVRYGAHPALNDISLNVDFGEIVVILGANGAGKSSLLKAIAGTSEGHVGGAVSLDGSPILGNAPDRIVEQGIAFVPEGRGIFGDLTVGENLTLGAYSGHARRAQTSNLARVYELFPKLRERNSQIARTMSGGEQQMVAIGRAMMSDPKFLMLDEPSLGLSPLLCKELFANLVRVRETGIGVLMVEQNAKQSLAIADRGYLIENGAIVGENDARSMLNDPAVQAAYLGGAAAAHAPAAATTAASPASPSAAVPAHPSGPATFISTSGMGSGQVAPVSADAIASMVAKAEQTSSQIVPRQAPSVTPSKPKRVVNVAANLPPAATPPVSQTMPPHSPPSHSPSHSPSPPGDPLQAMLRSMEDAAQSARLGNGSQTPEAAPKTIAAPPTEREEDLPTIPVYKKTKVEVYRRATDGSMQRVKR